MVSITWLIEVIDPGDVAEIVETISHVYHGIVKNARPKVVVVQGDIAAGMAAELLSRRGVPAVRVRNKK